MFQRSNKTNKSVTFNQEVADQTLLTVIETELAKQPHKTFSDLCKEALWQFLCVPESLRPSPKIGEMEQQIADLQRQFVEFEKRGSAKSSAGPVPVFEPQQPKPAASQTEQQVAEVQRQLAALEQRVMAKESGRLETLERQLHQLSQQMMQLALQVNQPSAAELTSLPEPPPKPVTPEPPPEEIDPEIARLRGLLEEF